MKTDRTAELPLFYTHPIGSLPRPQAVLDLIANSYWRQTTEAFRNTLRMLRHEGDL
jgi:hypothetical protein